jgi:hypothetical protein
MVSTRSLLAVSAVLALALCSAMDHLIHQNRQVEILTTASLSLTTGHNPSFTVNVPVHLDGNLLPIDSQGTRWGFVSVDMGICVVDFVDRPSIVLGGLNEQNSEILPASAIVGVLCES